MPWLFNEDASLKEKFTGIKIPAVNAPSGGLPVAVRFRLPEGELADLTYPSIIIDHAGISKDSEREHRGYVQIPYAPEGLAPWADNSVVVGDSPYWADFPIPYNLDYQITVFSRKAVHNMLLIGELSKFDRLPARFGYLAIPQDGTVRRLDILGGPDPIATKDADGKRIFQTVYSVRVSSELLQSQVDQYVEAMTVDLTLYASDQLYS